MGIKVSKKGGGDHFEQLTLLLPSLFAIFHLSLKETTNIKNRIFNVNDMALFYMHHS